jgi:hypothetical protein
MAGGSVRDLNSLWNESNEALDIGMEIGKDMIRHISICMEVPKMGYNFWFLNDREDTHCSSGRSPDFL